MPLDFLFRSVRPDLRPCTLDVADLPVLYLNGSTPHEHVQKTWFHTQARRYLRSVAGALAGAGYTQARIETHFSGSLSGGDTLLYSLRPGSDRRLIVVVEAGSVLGTLPGRGRADGIVILARWEVSVPRGNRLQRMTSRRGPHHFIADQLDSVELARRLLHDVMQEPLVCLKGLVAEGKRRSRQSQPPVTAQETSLPEPTNLVDFAKMTMRLEDDMAQEYPGWRYGCWADLPSAIQTRYACLAPRGGEVYASEP